MSEYFPKRKFLEKNFNQSCLIMQQIQILKNAADVDTSAFAKKNDLVNLKSDVDKQILINSKMYQVI